MQATMQIADAVRHQMIGIIAAAFDVPLTVHDVHMDLCKFNGHDIEATFSLHGVENVDRKAFQLRVQQLQCMDGNIKTFKVKSKRPMQNVRLYLDYRMGASDAMELHEKCCVSPEKVQ